MVPTKQVKHIPMNSKIYDYRCFLHRQEQGGQDRVFQFQGGLVNYKAHGDLS
jgi:hypothetical protein